MQQSLGDQLFLECNNARNRIWKIGEIVMYVVESISLASSAVEASDQSEYVFRFPVGLDDEEKLILSDRTLPKEKVISGVQSAANTAVPLSAIYNLTTVMESFLHDIVRDVCKAYPQKIPKEEQLGIGEVVSRTSFEEIVQLAIDRVISNLSYESPSSFARKAEKLISVDLLQIPAWHQYVEMKATRDIHIHNQGIANETYARKASTLARVPVGKYLPVHVGYLWRCYESCIKMTEELERRFNEIWPSVVKIEFDSRIGIDHGELPDA